MAFDVQSPDGAWWTVRRRWWPRLDKVNALDELSISERDFAILIVAVVIAAPLIVLLPVSFAAKLCGLQRWAIEIERDEEWVATEKVRGWSASVDRIESITAEVRAGTYSAVGDDSRSR